MRIKLLDKLFYVVYNSYYKHGEFKNDIPPLTVGGIFGIMLLCMALSVFCILGWINPVYAKLPKLNKVILTLVMLFFGALVYFIFYYDQRYRKIYNLYKENKFLNSQAAKIECFAFIIVVILLPMALLLIRNKIANGHWF